MLNQDLADKFLKDELHYFNSVKTLRDLFSVLFEVDSDDDSIESYICNDVPDILAKWSKDNNMWAYDMIGFIIRNLDQYIIELNIDIDKNYDVEPVRTPATKVNPDGRLIKEVRFTGTMMIANYNFDLDEWYINMPLD